MTRSMAFAVVVLAAAQVACGAVPLSWKIRLQCRSTNSSNVATFNLPAGASLLNQTPSIAADGSVAIRATFSLGSIQEGFFRGSGGTGGLIISNTGSAGYSSADLDLSDARLLCPLSGGAALEINSSGGALETTFDSPNAEDITVFARGRLIPDGVGYRGTTSSGTRKWVIDRIISAQRTQTVYLADGLNSNFSFLYPPTTNSAMQMGGKVDDINGVSSIIRVSAPDSVAVLFDSTAPNLDFISGATDMNSSGQVAFFARYDVGPTTQFRLLRTSGGTPDVIAAAGQFDIESTSMSTFPPAISDNSWVAFRARDAAGDALFIGDGTTLVRITGMNSTVMTDLGATTLGYSFGPGNVQALSGPIDINANGQIAFAGILANGSVGLFVAEPCRADFNNDGVVDLFDYLDFVQVFADEAQEADFNNDLVIDLFDYLDFVQAFAEGC